MNNIQNLAVAALLAFIAVSLLIATVQYTSDQIRPQNETMVPSGVNVTLPANARINDPLNTTNASSSGNLEDTMNGPGALDKSQTNSGTGDDPKKPDATPVPTPTPPPGPTPAKNPIIQLNIPPELVNYLFVIVIILIAIVLLAIMYNFIRRRRPRGQQAQTPLTPGDRAIAWVRPGYFEGDYRIRFPQIREPFPAIWGAGEALEVTIERKDSAKGEAVLDIDGNTARDVRLENGMTKVRLDLDKGDHRITVSTKDSIAGPSWAEVRIVDYREEIIRMFNELYTGYSACNGGIGDKLTPRELERAIGQGLPDEKKKPLSAAVTTFELANFSLHSIGRRDYERMYLSERDTA